MVLIKKLFDKEKTQSLNEFLNIKDIKDNYLYTLDGQVIIFIKVFPINIELLSDDEFHATRSYEMAKEYLLKQNIKLKNKEDVLEAIKIHTDGFTTQNKIACVLILCDKLDIKDTRLTEYGKTIIGIRQWQYIKNVNLDIKKDYIKIELICSSKINEKEFRDFYSTQKLFKAIENLKRNFHVEIDLTLNKEI